MSAEPRGNLLGRIWPKQGRLASVPLRKKSVRQRAGCRLVRACSMAL